MCKKWMWFALTLLLLGCDQWSKIIVQQVLLPYQAKAIGPGLNMVLVFNSGSAFGFLNHAGIWHQWFFSAFSILMSVALMIWMCYLPSKSKLQLFALSMILSGAMGNVIDRLRLGYVVDFVDVYYKTHHWPVFNFADSAICVGAVLLFLSSSDRSK